MAAIFYVRVDQGCAPPSLTELATRAGLEKLHRESGAEPEALYGVSEVLYGNWSVMESVRAQRQVLTSHVCLQLFPHLSDLLDRQATGTADASMPIAEAFRSACEALRPEAALFYTRPNEVEPEYIDAQYPKVLDLDGILLDESNPVLLYLDSEIGEHFPDAYRAGRDTLPACEGLLLFRGSGERRWW